MRWERDENERNVDWNQPWYRISREDAAEGGGLFNVMTKVKYGPKWKQRLLIAYAESVGC